MASAKFVVPGGQRLKRRVGPSILGKTSSMANSNAVRMGNIRTMPAQSTLDPIVSVLAVLTPFLLAVIGGVGWLWRRELERREAAEAKLSDKKIAVYTAIMDVFFDQFERVKLKRSSNEAEVASKMLKINKELILYGSDEVISIFRSWQESARAGDPKISHFGKLFVAIRRDLGYKRTKLTDDQVLRQFINDYDEAKRSGVVK